MVNLSKVCQTVRSYGAQVLHTNSAALRSAAKAETEIVHFAEDAKIYSAPREIQECVTKFMDKLKTTGVYENKNLNDTVYEYVKLLATKNQNYELIANLIKDPKQVYLYCISHQNLSKQFKDVYSPTKFNAIQNLALMRVFNQGNYDQLIKLKEFKDLTKGNIDIAYIDSINPLKKIDENYFQKVFMLRDSITKSVLTKTGINTQPADDMFKTLESEIIKSRPLHTKLLATIVRCKNKELANRLIETFAKAENLDAQTMLVLLGKVDTNPDMLDKFLRLNDKNPQVVKFALDKIENSDKIHITDDLYEYFAKYQKENKHVCSMELADWNSFLDVKGTDVNLLKKLVQSDVEYKTDLLYEVSENNVDYLRYLLNKNKLSDKTFACYIAMKDGEKFKNPQTWQGAEKIYDEMVERFGKIDKEFAKDLVIQKLRFPEGYEKHEKSGILKLIEEKKIAPNIARCFNPKFDFTPGVKADIELMLSGENSIIKKFDSYDDILKKTSSGDVISVNGKMYINNKGKIERWNMTEEKFNELFPPVERFYARQGGDDCYLLTVLDSIYRNPKTRGTYYKMFEQKGDNILVTIPAYKDYKGTITFPKGEVKEYGGNVSGAKHYQMAEQTYQRTAVRDEVDIPNNLDPLTTEDFEYLRRRVKGGQSDNVMREILQTNNDIQKNNKFFRKTYTDIFDDLSEEEKLTKVGEYLTKNANNPNFVLNAGIVYNNSFGHAIAIKGYNPETKMVTTIDPRCPERTKDVPVEQFAKDLNRFWLAAM